MNGKRKNTVRVVSILILLAMIVTMVGGMLSGIVAGAATVQEMRDQLDDMETKKEEARVKMEQYASEAADVAKTREALNEQITLAQQEIETVTKLIDELNRQIEIKTGELETAEQALSDKEELFSTRMRIMYERKNTSYLDVLLKAESFSDMLTRMEVISRVAEYDKRVVTEYTAARDDVKAKRDELKQAKTEQENEKQSLDYKKSELAATEKQQAALQESLESYKAEQQAEFTRIRDEMNAISAKIAEQTKQNAGTSGGGSYAPVDMSNVRFGGTFAWPTPTCTSISSPYGWRADPFSGAGSYFHNGTDIPAFMGEPIVAAADGVVTTAGWVSGYGNYTVINHGNGVATAYGHQSALNVAVGQHVSMGQNIGKIGSTGYSTGPHLHFEVYVNGSTVDPMSYF